MFTLPYTKQILNDHKELVTNFRITEILSMIKISWKIQDGFYSISFQISRKEAEKNSNLLVYVHSNTQKLW